MCDRFALYAKPHQIVSYFQVAVTQPIISGFNIAPGSMVNVVRENSQRGRELTSARWGLIPHWMLSKHPSAHFAQARMETVADKPAFREPFKMRRCLVLASGFYKWREDRHGIKQAYYCFPKQEGIMFAFAGLWDYWEDRYKDREVFIQSCTILTREAEEPLSHIHHRMPVILGPHQFARWLDYSNGNVVELQKMLSGLNPVPLTFRQVSNYVNNPTHNSERCLV